MKVEPPFFHMLPCCGPRIPVKHGYVKERPHFDSFTKCYYKSKRAVDHHHSVFHLKKFPRFQQTNDARKRFLFKMSAAQAKGLHRRKDS